VPAHAVLPRRSHDQQVRPDLVGPVDEALARGPLHRVAHQPHRLGERASVSAEKLADGLFALFRLLHPVASPASVGDLHRSPRVEGVYHVQLRLVLACDTCRDLEHGIMPAQQSDPYNHPPDRCRHGVHLRPSCRLSPTQ
jgi:hypothetical protein